MSGSRVRIGRTYVYIFKREVSATHPLGVFIMYISYIGPLTSEKTLYVILSLFERLVFYLSIWQK